MIVLCYRGCSTCKKALKWLNNHHINYTEREITVAHPNFDEIKKWHELSQLPIQKFFNTNGKLYKEKNLKNILPNLSLEETYRLLSDDGMLIKRPLVINDNKILIGFKEEEWEDKLL
ncbi:arsenate reductase family protein [Eggerthia catenaformis]|uniref:arsenate reductase family protein n=1 Tax=Eggerthia catenaformis TaxID=31973 RepID=UPI00248D99FC|nr:arsenate reductase family protein [Eggerthia catenaformis]